jgi:hypothetical protein
MASSAKSRLWAKPRSAFHPNSVLDTPRFRGVTSPACATGKLVHDYFGVDIGMVWITATVDLSELHAQVVQVLAEL